ncbi:MAG: hypothetical protein V1709_08555 [Planctomycetota bacterium]
MTNKEHNDIASALKAMQNTDGWKYITEIINEKIIRLKDKLITCDNSELQGIRGEVKSLIELLNTIQERSKFIVEEKDDNPGVLEPITTD